MIRNTKKVLAVVLASAMVLSLAACGDKANTDTTNKPAETQTTETKPAQTTTDTTTVEEQGPKYTVETFSGDYVYKDSVSTLATNWNPHTYETSDDSYPASFIRGGLYEFMFNDSLHPVEGKEAYEGYVIVPEMAASTPVDVTAKVRAEHPEFNIPESADSGYAYTIDLNPLCTWEDGTPINADTYVYSMKKLFAPELKNYRASDYMDGDFVIANAREYYYQGTTAYNALGETTTSYLAAGHTVDELYIDCHSFWGAKGYKDADGNEAPQWVCVTDTTVYDNEKQDDAFSGKELYDAYFAPGAAYEAAYSATYVGYAVVYPAGVDFSQVGIMKTGDYQITLVLGKSLKGFYLLYNLSGNWIVYEPYYEKCLTKIEGTDAWASTYNTSVETTMSYGPYKMVSYQTDKGMRFERNEKWYGYTDGKHIYQDPEDQLYYPMYQTTAIDTQVVAEAATRKLMFLKGQLMGYGLQSEDFTEYRGSEYCYVTPDETIFFFIFNGYVDAINSREAADDFDKSKFDLETLTLQSFRKAVAVTYDKEALCTAVSPARSGGYGLIGNNYIYDPDTGAKYRNTPQAKKALCDFYSIDVSKFASLDEAVNSITGYDEVAAKKLYKQAFDEALEKGFITDVDGDGVSDQTIEIQYSVSTSSAFLVKTIDYLNTKMNEVTKGTPFEGKILFKESAPYGNKWSTNLKNGLADTALAGWSGSALNPFSLTDLYTNPSKQYDAKWFDASSVSFEYDGVTMSLKKWSDCLNGETITVDGKDYNYGDGQADIEKRLEILAQIEYAVLMTYDYIPMLQNASMSLLSQQVFYVIEEYNPILGRGGIAYMKYNYDETAWAEFIKSQGGELKY